MLTSLAVVALVLPRAVPPEGTPGLTLAADAIEQQLATDGRLAGQIPADGELEQLDALYRDHGAAEIGPGETRARAAERSERLHRLAEGIRTRHGAAAVDGLRARAAVWLDDVLKAGLPPRVFAGAHGLADDQADGGPAAAGATGRSRPGSDAGALTPDQVEQLGRFPDMATRYGLDLRSDRLRDRFVARVLFKARWNAISGLPSTEGLVPIELQAYWGWLALEATEVPPAQRLEALAGYAAAGGSAVEEARGALLYALGDGAAAAEAFGNAYAETGNLRLRNHALAALALTDDP